MSASIKLKDHVVLDVAKLEVFQILSDMNLIHDQLKTLIQNIPKNLEQIESVAWALHNAARQLSDKIEKVPDNPNLTSEH